MTQEELKREIVSNLHFIGGWFGLNDNDRKTQMGYMREAERLVELINEHIAEVIGEDEYCPCNRCDCPQKMMNQIKAEQRKRAGL